MCYIDLLSVFLIILNGTVTIEHAYDSDNMDCHAFKNLKKQNKTNIEDITMCRW